MAPLTVEQCAAVIDACTADADPRVVQAFNERAPEIARVLLAELRRINPPRKPVPLTEEDFVTDTPEKRRNLRIVLCEHFWELPAIQRIVSDAGISMAQINWNGSSETVWCDILRYVESRGIQKRLQDVILGRV